MTNLMTNHKDNNDYLCCPNCGETHFHLRIVAYGYQQLQYQVRADGDGYQVRENLISQEMDEIESDSNELLKCVNCQNTLLPPEPRAKTITNFPAQHPATGDRNADKKDG